MIDNGRITVCNSATLAIFFFFFMTTDVLTAQPQKRTVEWHSMEEAQQLAEKDGKNVIVYAVKNWCVYCKKMDKNVFSDQAVIDSLNTYFYAVRLNLDSTQKMVFNGKRTTPQEFAQKHNLQATPTILFLDENGNIMGQQPGYVSVEMFPKLLAFMGSEAFQKMDFKMYLQKNGKASAN